MSDAKRKNDNLVNCHTSIRRGLNSFEDNVDLGVSAEAMSHEQSGAKVSQAAMDLGFRPPDEWGWLLTATVSDAHPPTSQFYTTELLSPGDQRQLKARIHHPSWASFNLCHGQRTR